MTADHLRSGMKLCKLPLDVHAASSLCDALETLVRAAEHGLPAAFLEHVREAFERPGDLICAITFDANGAPAVRTGNGGVLLEPTAALLELAAAAGVGHFDFRIKQGAGW
jgi:hypothetical protein